MRVGNDKRVAWWVILELLAIGGLAPATARQPFVSLRKTLEDPLTEERKNAAYTEIKAKALFQRGLLSKSALGQGSQLPAEIDRLFSQHFEKDAERGIRMRPVGGGQYDFEFDYEPLPSPADEPFEETRIAVAEDAEGNPASFLLRTFKPNYNWVYDSESNVHLPGSGELGISEFVREYLDGPALHRFFSTCQAVIFVGAASRDGTTTWNSELSFIRAQALAAGFTSYFREQGFYSMPRYLLSLGKFTAGSAESGDRAHQRPLILIGILECDPHLMDGANLPEFAATLARALEAEREEGFWFDYSHYEYTGDFSGAPPHRLCRD